MKHILKQIGKYIYLFIFGGSTYVTIEVFYRMYSHWSMFILGGLCFILCGLLNELFTWEKSILVQMFYGMLIITSLEFITGMIINVWLGLGLWDYSNMPLNLFGQICVPFMIIWYFLSGIAIIVDDYLRYWFFGEDKPNYTLFK